MSEKHKKKGKRPAPTADAGTAAAGLAPSGGPAPSGGLTPSGLPAGELEIVVPAVAADAQPIFATYWPAGPPSDPPPTFTAYRSTTKKSRLMLVGSQARNAACALRAVALLLAPVLQPPMSYTGTTFGNETVDPRRQPCKLMLGVVDAAAGTLTLLPVAGNTAIRMASCPVSVPGTRGAFSSFLFLTLSLAGANSGRG